MQFLKLIMLLSPVLAFTIPEGQPDGVYSVSIKDGEEVHTLIKRINADEPNTPFEGATFPARSPPSAKFLAKRDSFTCGGDGLNNLDTDKANSELDAQCGNGGWIGGGLSFYSIVRCTVAYACNFYWDSDQCYAADRQTASAGITAQCGRYNSGWSNDNLSYGYEDFCKAPGNNFCGHGR